MGISMYALEALAKASCEIEEGKITFSVNLDTFQKDIQPYLTDKAASGNDTLGNCQLAVDGQYQRRTITFSTADFREHLLAELPLDHRRATGLEMQLLPEDFLAALSASKLTTANVGDRYDAVIATIPAATYERDIAPCLRDQQPSGGKCLLGTGEIRIVRDAESVEMHFPANTFGETILPRLTLQDDVRVELEKDARELCGQRAKGNRR